MRPEILTEKEGTRSIEYLPTYATAAQILFLTYLNRSYIDSILRSLPLNSEEPRGKRGRKNRAYNVRDVLERVMPELFQRLRPIDTDGRLTAIHARSVYLPKFLQGQHGEISSEKILTLLEEFYEQSWQEQKGFGLLTDEEKAVPLFTPSEFYQWLLQSAFKEEQAIVPDHERQKYAEKLHIAQSNLQEESLTFEEIVRRARRTRDAQALFGGFSVVHTDESDLDPDDDIPEPQITDENRHLFLPTDIPPGSSKQDIFRARFLNGLPLWHPEDAKETISEADAAEGNRRYEERQARKRASDTSPHDDVD